MSRSDEKDHFGDKLRDAERAREEQFFKQRDQELLEKLRENMGAEAEAAAQVAVQGRCQKCGARLTGREQQGIEIDECPSCGGVWLDSGELEKLAGGESDGWLGRLFRGRTG
jgi:rubrerythrin